MFGRAYTFGLWTGLQVIDPERLVRDEDYSDVFLRASAVFHHFAFWEPDKRAWCERTLMRDELSFQYIHAMTTRVRMFDVNDAFGVTNQPDLGTRLRVLMKILSKQDTPQLFVEALFPGQVRSIDRFEFTQHFASHSRPCSGLLTTKPGKYLVRHEKPR